MGRFLNETTLPSWISTAISYFLDSGLFHNQIFLCIHIHPIQLFMGFSRQECWSGLSFPSPVEHILSELSSMSCPSWVALHGVVHSFIESDKAVVHAISLISFLWLWFSFCLPSDGEGLRGLWKLPDGRDWLWGKRIKLPTSIRSSKKQESSKKNLLLLYWLCQRLWLCISQQTVENSSRDGNTRTPDLPPEKSVCRSRSSS